MNVRNPKRRQLKRGHCACLWFALALLLAVLALHAKANTGQPGECSLTAMAALRVAQLPALATTNRADAVFVAFSRYIWQHAAGDKVKFLRWYRIACEQNRVPRYYRVRDGKLIRGMAV
ncbi:hypothetical protein [Marinobacter sp.]|uniref:hypothetical protein n=1 Tax=Marinobacter sp. TaxID=50741 RepID=UPI003A949D9B